MLRLIALILLLANGAFFAWSQGLLLQWGLGPVQQAEPQRMGQQIRPEALRIVGAEEARRIETAAPAVRAPECLQAGPLADNVAEAVRPALQAWPTGAWTLEPVVEPARWIIYMGKYQSVDNVNKKKAELRQIGVSFEPLSNPGMELGLSLGSFASQAAASQQLERLNERGVRTARVAQERAEVRGQVLKLPALDESLRPRLDELRPLLNGAALRPCR
jgi:hypothetical protein